MVDIHSHILWGLDDGAKSLDQSVEMLRLAAETGTTDIVATPHASHEYPFEPDRIRQRIEELQQNAPAGIRIHSGCDFHLNAENIEAVLTRPGQFTINGLDYLMVELPDVLIPQHIDAALERLLNAGLRPVITHPERVGMMWREPRVLEAWVEMGCLVQITGQSIGGSFGSRAANFSEMLLDHGLVHFVASDGHDLEFRPPRLDRSRELVVKKKGIEVAELLFESNPRATLQGLPITPPPRRKKLKKDWLGFLRG